MPLTNYVVRVLKVATTPRNGGIMIQSFQKSNERIRNVQRTLPSFRFIMESTRVLLSQLLALRPSKHVLSQ
jgi:hypothetical protein